jgi:hypothetical protein
MWYKKIAWNDLIKEVYEKLSIDEKNNLIYDLALFLKEFHNSLNIEKLYEFWIEKENYQSYLDLIEEKLKYNWWRYKKIYRFNL